MDSVAIAETVALADRLETAVCGGRKDSTFRSYRIEKNGNRVAWRVYTDFAEALQAYRNCRSGEKVKVYGVDLFDRSTLVASLQQVCQS